MYTGQSAQREVQSAKSILDDCLARTDYTNLDQLERVNNAVRALGVAVRRAKVELMVEAKNFSGAVQVCQEIQVRDPGNIYAKLMIRRCQDQALIKT